MAGRGLVAALGLLLLAAAAVYCLPLLGGQQGPGPAKEGRGYDLQADFSYRYFDLVEQDLLRNVSTFEQRGSLVEEVCAKYSDPFRPESRGLHESWPPADCFQFLQLAAGSSLAMCQVLKAGSSSWTVYTDRARTRLGSATVLAPLKQPPAGCWPECGEQRTHVVQVRHPLRRLLSAYRHVFERNRTHEDEFVVVPSLSQVMGESFQQLSWTQFVELLLRDELTSLPSLHRLEGGGPEGGGAERPVDSRVNAPSAWVGWHWAPYWYTCGVCLPAIRPRYTLHTDRLEQEAPLLLSALGLEAAAGPAPRALRAQGEDTERVEPDYYGKLSRAQAGHLSYYQYRDSLIETHYRSAIDPLHGAGVAAVSPVPRGP
jgi:hypothetical protein